MSKKQERYREMVVMANTVINGRQAMTLREIKLLRLAIADVDKEDKDFTDFSINDEELAKKLGLSTENRAFGKELKDTATKLFERYLEIKDDKGNWAKYHWINSISHKNGVLEMRLNAEVRPFFLELKNRFTMYELDYVLGLKSTYSVRLYEYLKSAYKATEKRKKVVEETIEKIREITATENKYKQISELKKRVLDPATNEISEKTDLIIEYRTAKTGRKITEIIFTVTDKEQVKSGGVHLSQERDPQSPEIPPGQNNISEAYAIQAAICAIAGNCSVDEATKIYAAYGGDMAHFYANFGYVTQRYDVANPIGYLLEISRSWPKISESDDKKINKKSIKKNGDVKISDDRKKIYEELDQLDEERFWKE